MGEARHEPRTSAAPARSGSETIDAALDNCSFDFPRGASSGNGLGTAYFEDGMLTEIVVVSGGPCPVPHHHPDAVV